MAEVEDVSDEQQQISGSPCDEIDPAEIFENQGCLGVEIFPADDRGSGSEFDSEREEIVDLSSENELSDSFPYGVTPPRNIRRRKEKSRREKDKVISLLKSPVTRSYGSNPSERTELDRRKKRGSTQLTTERAFQRQLKRGSVDVGFVSVESGVHSSDTSKSLDMPSIKIETSSPFMSLDCVCEDSSDTSGIYMRASTVTESGAITRRNAGGHKKASRSESAPHSSSTSKNFLNPYCPEARMEFYRTFSLLIKLGSLAHKERQYGVDNSALERQSSEENKKWQVALSQALWLELQAWHANRTMAEQDQYLIQARANVEEVLDEVINFKVKKQDGDSQTLNEETEKNNCENNQDAKGDSGVLDTDGTVCSTNDDLPTSTQSSHSVDPSVHNSYTADQENFFQTLETSDTEHCVNENSELSSTETDSFKNDLDRDAPDYKALRSRLSLDFNHRNQKQCPSEAREDCFSDKTYCQLKAAIDQVTELFDKLEMIEHLYPTRKNLGEQNEKYTSKDFTRNFETLCLWLNVTRELYHKLHSIAKFVGVNPDDTKVWQDWLDVGLGRLDDMCPASDLNLDNETYFSLSDDDNDDEEEEVESNEDDDDDDDADDTEQKNGTVPSSPMRTMSYESQTSTPSRPSRASSNLSNCKWSSTSRYRPFVDHSIKKMGLIKLGKRLGDILDTSMMKARQALVLPSNKCQDNECQCCNPVKLEHRKWSVNHLDALMNGKEEPLQLFSCSCHPHRRAMRCGSENFDHGIWVEEFIKETGLPSFRLLYLFLARVPLDIIHECLRLRLQHRPKGEPSSLSVRQLLRECKDVLLGGVLVKDYYLDLVGGISNSEDLNKENTESDIEGFEQDLQSLLLVYFEYLHNVIHLVQRLPQASKGLKNILEEEWSFVKKHCRHIRGGEVEGGTRFCVMASGLLESTGDFLESELDQSCSDLHNNTDHGEDLRRKVLEACRGFKLLFNEARERASKALGFTKKLQNDLENAAKFSIDVPMNELLMMLETSGHVQVIVRHTAGLFMFVPKTMVKKKCQIIHLLNSCCVHEEHGDQVVSDGSGYLLILPPCALENGNDVPVTWNGKTIVVSPTMDTAISLADIQVGGMILVVQNSKDLDEQREVFLDSMSYSVSIVKQRTSSHQAIAEALDELQEACLSLREKIVSAVERVDENLDLDSMFEMEETEKAMVYHTYTETMHLCYNVGFEYQKEVARLVFGERKDTLGQKMLNFSKQWMKFVMSKCERGRGTRPRWANQGLDFLTVACDPKTLNTLSESAFQELKKTINGCICHVIGSAESCSGVASPAYRSQSPACPSPVFGRSGSTGGLLRPLSWPAGKPSKSPGDPADSDENQSTRRQLSDPLAKPQFQSLATDVNGNDGEGENEEEGEKDGIKHKDSFVAEPGAPRLEKVRHSLNKLERKRNDYLYEKHVIGRVSNRRRDIVKELACISSRKVPFKWQRGNKIGEGQFGKVYACVNLDTGEMMAVKQIKFQPNDHGEIRDLADEIKNFEGIRHESLVKYYGVELHRDEMFIFMEYCADGTISDVAKLGLPETMIRVYAYQILVAVSVLHEKGIVHRDVKGANIFVSSDGVLKLGDFGSSIKLKNPLQTIYGEISNIRGTVAYMAPEVITLDKGAGYGRAADIWSIGCVVVEMATGKPPWPDCDNNFVIMFKVGEGATPAIPESLSEEGQDFLLCCFLHDPYERHTASQLMDHSFVKVDL